LKNIWRCTTWRSKPEIYDQVKRKGLRFRFKKSVDLNVRRACLDFGKWLRSNYDFPIRVVIYFKETPYIKALDGTLVSATFFEPFSKLDEPYIRISTGDFERNQIEWGTDNALAAVLGSIVHELTHYYQWVNDIELTEIGFERQASHYSDRIISEYSQTREHP
jgi:hypothetical protein